MAWIESHTVLSRHRKLRELAVSLRLRPSYAMGHLHSLWHAALEQQEDGDLSLWSDQFIADQADFPGDAPQFVRLLQTIGWLDDKVIHDWLDYAGRYLEAKYRTSNPSRLKEIWKKHGISYDTGNSLSKGKRKSDFSQTKDGPPTLDNQPNQPNQPNQSIWGELPASLSDPRISELLGEFSKNRSELGKKLTPTGAKRILKKGEKWGVEKFVTALELAVEHGWRGVWEPGDNSRNGSKPLDAMKKRMEGVK